MPQHARGIVEIGSEILLQADIALLRAEIVAHEIGDLGREDLAQQKAAEIAQSHPDLSPTVFQPNGRGPFLVTLGGPMTREDAFAFSGKAKREGMPKDIYAQNYRRSEN